MSHISANDLKTKGVAAIQAVLFKHAEANVSVRGKDRFVVMDMAQFTICANANWKLHWRKPGLTWERGAL